MHFAFLINKIFVDIINFYLTDIDGGHCRIKCYLRQIIDLHAANLQNCKHKDVSQKFQEASYEGNRHSQKNR